MARAALCISLSSICDCGFLAVQQHRDRRHTRHDLFQQFETLSTQFRRNDAETGRVPAWPCKIVYQTGCNRIAYDGHDDRDRSGCGLERLGGDRPTRDDDINIASYQLSGKPGERLNPVLSPSPFNRNRPSLDMAEFSQTIKECRRAQRERCGRAWKEHADPGHFRLLRMNAQRPRRHAAGKKRHEIAPLHRASGPYSQFLQVLQNITCFRMEYGQRHAAKDRDDGRWFGQRSSGCLQFMPWKNLPQSPAWIRATSW